MSSDEEQPTLLRVDSHQTNLDRKLSRRKSGKPHQEEFIWEDEDYAKSSPWAKWIPLISLLVIPLVLIPFFVGRSISSLTVLDNSKNPELSENDTSSGDLSTNGIVVSQELMRWGIWLTTIYSLFVISWLLLHYLPFFMFRMYILITRRKSEKFKDMFEYLRGLRRFIIWLSIAIGSNIVFGTLWLLNRSNNTREAPEYIVIIAYLLRIFVFYSIFRLGEKVLMMLLFVHLKNKTFKSRIEDSKQALGIIEHLEVQLDKNNAWKQSKGRLVTEGSRLFSWMKNGHTNEVDITSTINAKRLAKKLFNSLSHDGQIIVPSDFYPYFGDADAAMHAFYLFDKDRNGDISKAEMKTAVINVYQERRFILSSFKDINDVVMKLDRILFIIVCIITIIFGFTVFGSNVLAAAVPLLSGSLALSFMFAETAREFFASLLFLFGTHPFDSGDIILI